MTKAAIKPEENETPATDAAPEVKRVSHETPKGDKAAPIPDNTEAPTKTVPQDKNKVKIHKKYVGKLRPLIAAYVYNTFCLYPDQGTTVEDVMNPAFWSNVAMEMQPKDQIEVLDPEGQWYLKLLVVDKGDSWAKCKVLHFADLSKEADEAHGLSLADAAAGYVVKQFGGPQKWGVERASDKRRIHTGCNSKAAAEAWLDEHKKALAK